MNDCDFALLAESIKQAGEIRRGERRPGRVFEFSPLDVKAISPARFDQSQSEVPRMIGVSVATLQNWDRAGASPRDLRAHC